MLESTHRKNSGPLVEEFDKWLDKQKDQNHERRHTRNQCVGEGLQTADVGTGDERTAPIAARGCPCYHCRQERQAQPVALTCEWRRLPDARFETGCGMTFFIPLSVYDFFTFCPVCGEEIA